MLKYSLFLFALLVSVAAQAAETIALKDFSRFGINARAVRHTAPSLKKLSEKEDQYFLEVKLGRLSQAQFDSMKALYGNQSQVPYDAKKEYDLVDFLHPAIQASVNQTFKTSNFDTSALSEYLDEDSPIPGEDRETLRGLEHGGISLSTNCWNTTSQVLKLQNAFSNTADMRFQLYWPGRWDMNYDLKNPEFSAEVTGAETTGDVLILSNSDDRSGEDPIGMLQHSAILLSDTLVFEKTDSSDNDPYRISFRADVLAKYKRGLQDALVVSYRRYNQPGQKTFLAPGVGRLKDNVSQATVDILNKILPGLVEIPTVEGCETSFGGGCSVTLSEIREVQVVIDAKTGRGVFQGPKELLDRFEPISR